MINLACPIPHKIVIAVSGGPDSMALLDFCRRGRKDITILHINHGTQHAKEAHSLVYKYAQENKIDLVVRYTDNVKHTENDWRNYRLEVYRGFTQQELYVATGHQLDDLVEWYLLGALHGKPKFMVPGSPHRLIKPFLYTEKKTLVDWCNTNNVPYVNDPTNIGNSNARAILRSIMPQLLKIHPGLKTSIGNKAQDIDE